MGELRQVSPARAARPTEPTDQRTSLRFDARGRLAGHLVGSNQPVFVVNIGLGGFGVEAPDPIVAGPHIVRLTTTDNQATLLEACSVYCRPKPWVDSERRFAVGFTFTGQPPYGDQTIKGILERVVQVRFGR